jgi:hypothetical protein
MFVHPTGVVPAHVVDVANRARFYRRFWLFIVIAVVYVGVLRPRFIDLFAPIENALLSLAALFLEIVADVCETLAVWLVEGS